MSASPVAIPYEKQSDPLNSRTCGAACLAMAYRSLGREVPQAEIWPAIGKMNRFGSLASTTYLMAQDALKRGFTAVAIQTRHPLQVLRLCRDHGIRAVLNHRPRKDSPAGHYSLLVDMDDKNVIVHDPSSGPSRSFPHDEMLELWQPRFPNSEIAGYIMIAIAPASATSMPACEFCHTAMPAKVECPQCKRPVGLRPGIPLGCVNHGCIARMWNFLCCPSCDYTWTFSIHPGSPVAVRTEATAEKAAEAPEPVSLAAAFAELDKFCSYVLTVPGAANNPEVTKQLDFIAASKERLVLSRAEGLSHLEAHQQSMAAMTQRAKQGQDEHRKKMEAVNQPPPHLDGNALGAALLKNLGFK